MREIKESPQFQNQIEETIALEQIKYSKHC